MNLREYKEIILNTTEDDWTVNACWGYGSGPSYLNSFEVSTDMEGNFMGIDVESHSMIASLKRDLSISIAWGYPLNEDFKEPWANKFTDSHAASRSVDFFYNGTLVFRDVFVSVDGGRCYLPLPDREFDSSSHKVIGYHLSREKYDFFRMLDRMEIRLSDFDEYFKEAGFKLVNTPWME